MKRLVGWLIFTPFIAIACASTDDPALTPQNDGGGTIVEADGGQPPGDPDAGKPENGGSSGTTSVCGDGEKTPGEECDDGNTDANDGCSPTCKFESAGPTDTCPGAVLTLTGTGFEPRKGSIAGTTAGNFNQYAGSCGGGAGGDVVYVVTSDVSGVLTAKLTSTFDSMLYARHACDDAKTEVACDDASGLTGGEVVTVGVIKGQPLYLVVDGFGGNAGTFTLDVEVATASCGNGMAESPEACDDGNNVAGDGCAPDCTLETGGVLDDCPGQDILLTGTGSDVRHVSLANSTASLTTSSITSTICPGGGPNHVYAINSDVDGSLTARLVAQFVNATLILRTECGTTSTQLQCLSTTPAQAPLELSMPIAKGIPRYVMVDSGSTIAKGDYLLDITVTPASCGNKRLDAGEQCDDGNRTAGDGCAADCMLEPVSPAIDTCPGAPIGLSPGTGGTYVASLTSSTASLASDFKPKSTVGNCSTTLSGRDALYMVSSPVSGLLRASVNAGYDAAIYAQTAPCSGDAGANVELSCSAMVDGVGIETIVVPVVANTPVGIIVDGEAANLGGLFQLDLTVTPGSCGNGVVEGGESCDDGNTATGDGCNSVCALEPATSHDTCANSQVIDLVASAGGTYAASVASGTTNLAHDQTFLGCTSSGPDAFYTITAPIDGVLTAEVPTAAFNVSLGARTTAVCPTTTATTPLACANANTDDGQEQIMFSVVKGQSYWIIVDGSSKDEYGPFTLNLTLHPPGCGDGLISGTEQCDDGNAVNGDGCSATCTAEPLPNVDTCPGYELALTGSGPAQRVGVVTVDTSNLTANYGGSCGGSGAEGVVVVTPPVGGKLKARLQGVNYHAVLHARSTCGDATTELACDVDAVQTDNNREIIIPGVTAGTPVYLFVDGFNGETGVGILSVTVTP